MLPVTGLDAVAGAVGASTAAIGSPPDHDRFRGHLTLARLRTPAAAASAAGAAFDARFAVTEITLVASHIGAGPARYEVLERFSLAPPVPPAPPVGEQ